MDGSEALLEVYMRLKDRYELMMTNTMALDDGFTIDCPILVGKACGRMLYLYDEGNAEFVLDVMDEERTKGTHWHPADVTAAIEDIAVFMEGKEEYPMKRFDPA